jgi:hypothetical protein
LREHEKERQRQRTGEREITKIGREQESKKGIFRLIKTEIKKRERGTHKKR